MPSVPAPDLAEHHDADLPADDPLVRTLVWVVAGVILVIAAAAALVVLRSVATATRDLAALTGLVALGWCAGLTVYVRRMGRGEDTS